MNDQIELPKCRSNGRNVALLESERARDQSLVGQVAKGEDQKPHGYRSHGAGAVGDDEHRQQDEAQGKSRVMAAAQKGSAFADSRK